MSGGLFRADQLRELAQLLGSEEAAARLDRMFAARLFVMGHPDGMPEMRPSLAEARRQASLVAKATAALLASIEPMGGLVLGLDFTWRKLYPDEDRGKAPEPVLARHALERVGETWEQLIEDVRLLAEVAAKNAARKVPRGRAIPWGMGVFGMAFRKHLEREGIPRSSALKSPMVKAFALFFEALGIERDAREFVRTLNGDRVRKTS